MSNSSKPTVVSIGTKLQDLGDRVAATNMDNYSNADSGLRAFDKFCEIFVCNDTHSVNDGVNECLILVLMWRMMIYFQNQ